MNKIVFFRRKKLGLGSVRGMSWFINGDESAPKKRKMGGYIGGRSGYVRNDYLNRMPNFNENDYLVRWGCTSRTEGISLERQINLSSAIKEVGFKRDFRMKCMDEAPHIVPESWASLRDVPDDLSARIIVRRDRHAQGKDLWVVDNKPDLMQCMIDNNLVDGGWYASYFVDKTNEYRVYMVEGRVVTIAEKVPENPDDVAWNVAQGGEFTVLKWDSWPISVCKVAKESFDLTSLDFAGIDIMIDAEGRAYLIEINSAPSLPFLSDGSVSYRQKAMAKAFKYIQENGKGSVAPIEQYEGWRDVIHPATWTRGRRK